MKKENIVYSYTIESHPNKDKVFQWIRENWHDLGEHYLREFEESFTALAKHLGVAYDFCISQLESRGEFLKLGDFDPKLLENLPADYPLTGSFYDEVLISALKNNELGGVLDSLHRGCEYLYSDEGLQELCEADEYEFKENGSIFK